MAFLIHKRKRNVSAEKRWRNTGSAVGLLLFRVWRWIQKRGKSIVLRLFAALLFFFVWYTGFIRADPNDPFARPFCDAKGVCNERPDKSSPRTAYSSWNKKQYHLWWSYYETLQERVRAYAEKRQHIYDKEKDHKNSDRTRPLILLGDSITESWSGTGLGLPKDRAKGVPEVLENMLSSSGFGFDPIVLGVSGDQTQHLLFRLESDHMRAAQLLVPKNKKTPDDGETTLEYDPGAVFVVMIGTNNLGSGELPGPTSIGVLAVMDYILKETTAAGCKVMLFHILPRGDGEKNLPKLCPPRCSDNEAQTPYSSFLPAINQTNTAVTEGINVLEKIYPNRISFIDCGADFLNEDYEVKGKKAKRGKSGDENYEVKKGLMPDLLHPNAGGHQYLATCMKNVIYELN